VAGADCVGSVDPVNSEADYRTLEEVPTDAYDTAYCCVPDRPKMDLLRYLVEHGKHALVEKPLWVEDEGDLHELKTLAADRGVVVYTAYNHRFEPHFVRMRDIIASGELGRIFRCRMFYGNGTARLVRESEWRDQDAGVLPDLGSHLLDTARSWFGDIGDQFRVISSNRFENRSPDYVVIGSPQGALPELEMEMTLLSWRNHFTCDVFAESGSAHIESLCKWGPSTFTVRRRILPSGRPPEEAVTLVEDDPTWLAEHEHFTELCRAGRKTDLEGDIWLHRALRKLSDAVARVP
jgi:predicted dehydrogenase